MQNSAAAGTRFVSWSELEERLIDFASSACTIALSLRQNQVGKRITDQLVRSSTSHAANYREARGAESQRDFTHKMQICLKELREISVWLRIAARLELSTHASQAGVLQECNQLTAIFVRSIKTAKGL